MECAGVDGSDAGGTGGDGDDFCVHAVVLFWLLVFGVLGEWEMEFLIGMLFACFVCGCLGGMIGEGRGRGGAGFMCGFLLGPLGVVIALLLPREEKQPTAIPPIQKRRETVVPDQVDLWEAQERNKKVLPVPIHLRGRQVDEE
jgi:hypothetical protein